MKNKVSVKIMGIISQRLVFYPAYSTLNFMVINSKIPKVLNKELLLIVVVLDKKKLGLTIMSGDLIET